MGSIHIPDKKDSTFYISEKFEYDFSNADETYVKHAEKHAEEVIEEDFSFQKEETVKIIESAKKQSPDMELEEILDEFDLEEIYLKPFEQYKQSEEYKKELNDTTNKYLCNIYDLPKNIVFEIKKQDDHRAVAIHKKFVDAVKNRLGENFCFLARKQEGGRYKYQEATKYQIQENMTYESIGNMINNQDYQKFFNMTNVMSAKYSPKNLAMIYVQYPDAAYVKGENDWNKGTSRGKSDETGKRYLTDNATEIMVYTPNIAKKNLKSEHDIDNFLIFYTTRENKQSLMDKLEKAKNEGKDHITVDYVKDYSWGFVYDISQTYSEDKNDRLDELLHIKKDFDTETSEIINDTIKSFKNGSEIIDTFQKEDYLDEQERIYNHLKNFAEYTLRKNPDSITGITTPFPLKGDLHKIETIIAAEIISSHIGVDALKKATAELSVIMDSKNNLSPEIMENGKREMFFNCFDRGVKVAKQWIKEFDKRMDLQQNVEKTNKRIVKEVEK